VSCGVAPIATLILRKDRQIISRLDPFRTDKSSHLSLAQGRRAPIHRDMFGYPGPASSTHTRNQDFCQGLSTAIISASWSKAGGGTTHLSSTGQTHPKQPRGFTAVNIHGKHQQKSGEFPKAQTCRMVIAGERTLYPYDEQTDGKAGNHNKGEQV